MDRPADYFAQSTDLLGLQGSMGPFPLAHGPAVQDDIPGLNECTALDGAPGFPGADEEIFSCSHPLPVPHLPEHHHIGLAET